MRGPAGTAVGGRARPWGVPRLGAVAVRELDQTSSNAKICIPRGPIHTQSLSVSESGMWHDGDYYGPE